VLHQDEAAADVRSGINVPTEDPPRQLGAQRCGKEEHEKSQQSAHAALDLPAPVGAEAVDVDDLLVDPVGFAVVDDGLAGLGLVAAEVIDDAEATR